MYSDKGRKRFCVTSNKVHGAGIGAADGVLFVVISTHAFLLHDHLVAGHLFVYVGGVQHAPLELGGREVHVDQVQVAGARLKFVCVAR